MASLADWIQQSTENLDSLILEADDLNSRGIAAAQFYHSRQHIAALAEESSPMVTVDTELTASEWGLISPLFFLYMEKEQATLMEASQVMGITQYGRTSSEIQGEINAYEERLPRLAFTSPVITV